MVRQRIAKFSFVAEWNNSPECHSLSVSPCLGILVHSI